MGRYFGREPRYSQQEAEAQAKEAVDAAVRKGRPPAEEWNALASRMGEINRELSTRPPVEIPQPPPRRATTEAGNAGTARRPRDVSQILRPRQDPAPEPAESKPPTGAPAARAPRPPAAAPAKGARRAPDPAAKKPVKRSSRATEPRAAGVAKRPAAKKRPG